MTSTICRFSKELETLP